MMFVHADALKEKEELERNQIKNMRGGKKALKHLGKKIW